MNKSGYNEEYIVDWIDAIDEWLRFHYEYKYIHNEKIIIYFEYHSK